MLSDKMTCTAVSSEAWAKLRDWASVAGRGRLLLSGSVAHASIKTAVQGDQSPRFLYCVAMNLGVPPGWFGTSVASYCPSRLWEFQKLN